MLLPAAAVKQKAKEGLERLVRALFYPSVKRSPCAFGFCVRLDCAGCLRGKKRLLFLLAFKRKRFKGYCIVLKKFTVFDLIPVNSEIFFIYVFKTYYQT
jgi:hypothetical protein